MAKRHSTLIPAAGYIRMSTDQQEDSPARQRSDIHSLAKRSGYRIVVWYEDHGITGTESANRPEFQRLLADAKNGTFRAVLLSEQSRMSREDVFDVMLHWRLLRDAGVTIVTCQRGELRFDDLGGMLTAIVDQYGAHEESVKIAHRALGGKKLAVLKGSKQGGIPFGYDKQILDADGKLVRRVTALEQFRRPPGWTSRLVPAADTRSVKAVQFMFERLADGCSQSQVAKELNRNGYRTMHGHRFNSASVRRTVTNPVYVGDLVFGKKRRRGKFTSLYEEGGVACENTHEPLIDRAVFERVQKRIRGGETRRPRPGKFLLTGIVYSTSGLRLQGCVIRSSSPNRPPNRYYTVRPQLFDEYPDKRNWPSFKADVIEAGVLAKLKEFLASERVRKAVHAEIVKRTRKARGESKSLENRLADVRSRIERGTENLALAAPDDVPGISRLLAHWRDEADDLKRKLQRVTTADQPTPEAMETIRRYDELLDHLEQADRVKLADAIRQTVKRVTLQREERKRKPHRVVLWTGTIELHDEFGEDTTIPLTDEDIPTAGRWREVVRYARERGDVVYVGDVAALLGTGRAFASTCLAKAVLAGKLANLGHQKGWRVAE